MVSSKAFWNLAHCAGFSSRKLILTGVGFKPFGCVPFFDDFDTEPSNKMKNGAFCDGSIWCPVATLGNTDRSPRLRTSCRIE
ncbi:hypothetical protein TNCV_4527071 [Trichonephila clavipes]|nr:hypothetical protein TNCV_4527071 [Trichonephila clavipes]